MAEGRDRREPVVAEVTVHFEGHPNLRPGFHKLFEHHVERTRRQRVRFKLIAGGSRAEAVKDFLRSCTSQPSNLNLLLVDSEEAVPDTASAIQSLRDESFWDGSAACVDDQINFMVQAMEAWFIADPQALVKHFGHDFNSNVLPSPQNAEKTLPKDMTAAIRRGLGRGGSRRRDYDKVTDGLKLLQLIEETRVSQHCPHFRRLMNFLCREI